MVIATEPSRRAPARVAAWGLLLSLSWAAACTPAPTESDPLALSRAYFEALRRGDWRAARLRAWKPPESSTAAAELERLRATNALLSDGRLRVEPVAAREAGDWALVVLRVFQQAPGGEVRVLRPEWLVRQDGSWRIVPPSLLTEPEVLALRDSDREALAEWFRTDQEALTQRWLQQLP